MSQTIILTIVLAVAQQPPAPTPSASQPVAMPLQGQSRPATFLQSDVGSVQSLAFSPDGKTLAAGYSRSPRDGGGVVLWDVAGRKRVVEKSLPVTEGIIIGLYLAFSSDGKTLAAEYACMHNSRIINLDHHMVLWDVAERKRLMQAPMPRKVVGRLRSMAFSPDGKTLAAACGTIRPFAGSVLLWDVAERKLVVEESLPATYGVVTNAAFSPCANILATSYAYSVGTPSEGVVLWDVSGRKLLIEATLPVKAGQVVSMAFTPDGKTLAAACGRKGSDLVLWDVTEHKLVTEATLPVKASHVARMAFTPDGKTLAAACVHLSGLKLEEAAERNFVVSVVLWNVAERKLVVEESLPVTHGDLMELTLTFSPDCKTLAVGYDYVLGRPNRYNVMLWEVAGCPRGN